VTQIRFERDKPTGLYLHIPFCERKCPYCDFNSYAGQEDLYRPFARALAHEIRTWGERLAHPPLRSVFLGGGTPTVLPPDALEDILIAVHEAFAIRPPTEITVEANPGTTDRALFRLLRDLGVNRLSVGAQSFREEELRFLGRIHTVEDIYRAVEQARAVGFDNVSLDVIYGLPGQTPEEWAVSLRAAVSLDVEHLSCYALTVEPHTPLARWVAEGRVPPVDEDVQGDLYDATRAFLAQAGYIHYEISNWARPGRESVHNRVYWWYEPYLGLGPGAHSFDGVRRAWTILSPREYIRRVRAGESPLAGGETLSLPTRRSEAMILGLRLLVEGVSRRRFRRLFGTDPLDVFADPVERFRAVGLLAVRGDRILLTERAYAVANQVFQAFLA